MAELLIYNQSLIQFYFCEKLLRFTRSKNLKHFHYQNFTIGKLSTEETYSKVYGMHKLIMWGITKF